ncbi:MAG: single-stranded DNA-binding protein [Candidatus Parcubacteria bacterium]|nr:single-stranded DNA-binding protein [Candidatus Paceibacterota bacterium]
MNKIYLIGNLTKDPEVRTTTTGKKVTTIVIAVNDGKGSDGQDLVQYFTIKAWDKQAEIIEMYVKKGHKLAVIGKLQNRKWDKPDGTIGYATEVTMSEMELLTSRAEAERLGHSTPQSEPASVATSKPSSPARAKAQNDDLPAIDINDLDIKVSMPF